MSHNCTNFYGEWTCSECARDVIRERDAALLQVRDRDEEITSLKESLRDVLEISEVDGAANLTTEEYAKIKGAKILLGPESRFAQRPVGAKCPRCDLPVESEAHREECAVKRKCDCALIDDVQVTCKEHTPKPWTPYENEGSEGR